ncbi:hypothetical protein ADIMK_2132 [Marinobacterium lacunae]|uniref:Uncharacterized protein n=1 Tax=Marinobacterium lacunae TaxID=1232683 RepID=A0A081FYS1_9GAMM|nr:hypothetical protein ADIMK_2132 [Marinobacterium lacunae]
MCCFIRHRCCRPHSILEGRRSIRSPDTFIRLLAIFVPDWSDCSAVTLFGAALIIYLVVECSILVRLSVGVWPVVRIGAFNRNVRVWSLSVAELL